MLDLPSLVARLHTTIGARDRAAVGALLHPDVRLHGLTKGMIQGRIDSALLLEYFSRTTRFENCQITQVIAQGDAAAFVWTDSPAATPSGAPHRNLGIGWVRVEEELVAELWMHVGQRWL